MNADPRHNIAIIPARGGSQRIPRKNVMPLAGLPLVAHSILHARAARLVSAVYVSTDDAEIADVSRYYGAQVIDRPKDLSGAEASSESALIHALNVLHTTRGHDPDLVIFLQCTSPVRRLTDIDATIDRLTTGRYDSVFSACRDWGLFWVEDKAGLRPINYDPHSRRREQDMGVQYRENGSIFVFRPEVLRRNNCRMGGRIGVYEMDFLSSLQLDRPEEADMFDWILGRPEYAWPRHLIPAG